MQRRGRRERERAQGPRQSSAGRSTRPPRRYPQALSAISDRKTPHTRRIPDYPVRTSPRRDQRGNQTKGYRARRSYRRLPGPRARGHWSIRVQRTHRRGPRPGRSRRHIVGRFRPGRTAGVRWRSGDAGEARRSLANQAPDTAPNRDKSRQSRHR